MKPMAVENNSGSIISMAVGVCGLVISKIFLFLNIHSAADAASWFAIIGFGINLFINYPKIVDRVRYIIKKYFSK